LDQGGGQLHPDPAVATAAGSIGLATFYLFFLKSINGGWQLNVTASVNRLTEANKTTASKKAGLTVTFDWRRLQCPPPLIQNAGHH
jgi:hypothetical protein